ncbi:putative class III protein [Botryosphaeria dothidea]|uniref:chitinase n=1 Tax=Botryosphaeria dothidea TaxID=55169 RepID=A0A8H4J0W0_9PEZI|nr:putative class III protein [Botryosphaeria dothidea]
MPSKSTLASVIAGLFALHGVEAGFNSASKSNVAVYWGQNSYGQGTGDLAQQRLSYYCENSDIDIIPMAFMTTVTDDTGHPQLNFANQGDHCSTFSGTQLLNCSELAADIPTCQSQYNKTITLSIGGATYTEGGFSTADEAVAAANLVWATFGPPTSNSSILRPFGNASVDGFDFDFESTVSNMQPFAQQLRTLMDAQEAADGAHRILTAAPQCPYPDAADNSFLSGPNGDGVDAVAIDAVFVQFYNNYCGLQSYVANATDQWNFNFATWDAWAKDVAAKDDVKVFLGVPASSTAAGSGYKSASDLAPIIEYVANFSSFGGVMMWDASQAYANEGFLSAVKSELEQDAAQRPEETCSGYRTGEGARAARGYAA